jgi:uncharacterized protein (TIGR01777 family)
MRPPDSISAAGPGAGAGEARLRVLITGARGFLGSALAPVLRVRGHHVATLTRGAPGPGEIRWDPAGGVLEARALEGFDAVVHLAGEPIGVRWTAERKASIRASRVEGTRLLANRLAGLERPPRVLVSVSAIGFYGDRGDEILDERSPPGTGFLPDLCRAWEEAAAPASSAGIRVVHPRLGLVLASRGGVLARMLPAFRLGLGGPLGGGRAWWSWVVLDDVVAAFLRALGDEHLAGPVNVVAPVPVRNGAFARTLGKALSRPAFLPAPSLVLRALFGEMADEALLASARVEPSRLRAAGHSFRFPDLEEALRCLVGRGGGERRAA